MQNYDIIGRLLIYSSSFTELVAKINNKKQQKQQNLSFLSFQELSQNQSILIILDT